MVQKKSHHKKGTSNIPVTKLRCNIINVPQNKQKSMNEEWLKIWKQMSAIPLSDWTAKLFFLMSPSEVWEMFFSTGNDFFSS